MAYCLGCTFILLVGWQTLHWVDCAASIENITVSPHNSPFFDYLCDDDLLKSTANKLDLLTLKLENNNLRYQHELAILKLDLLDELKITLETFEHKLTSKINAYDCNPQYERKLPTNCAEAMHRTDGISAASGIFQLYLPTSGLKPFHVFCLQDHKGGEPWTVIQRRRSNTTDFYRGWHEYRNGFGNLDDEFFIGLEKLYALTHEQMNELWIEMEDYESMTATARYDSFAISNELDRYALSVLGKYSGTAGDSLSIHYGAKFTTMDSDNDDWIGNCAVKYTGAWWYNKCHSSNLNGQYLGGEYSRDKYAKGIVWESWHGYYYSPKYVHMAIRPRKNL